MVNFPALEDMILVNEARLAKDQVYMCFWHHPCGTHGCLCGNYALDVRPDFIVPEEQEEGWSIDSGAMQKHLGISSQEFKWLFLSTSSSEATNRFCFSGGALLSGDRALARLKKFVAYKKDKASVSIEQGRQISSTNICRRLSLSVSA